MGYLKDKFGVSEQVIPTGLDEMLRDHNKKKVERVINAFLKMKKFDFGELKKDTRDKEQMNNFIKS